VSNPGDRDLAGVQVVDALPAGLEAITASDGGVVSDGRVTWPAMGIRARDSRTLTVSGAVSGTASGETTNVALASSPTEGVREAEARVTLSAPTDEPIAMPGPGAKAVGTRLTLTKTGPARIRGGKVGLYRITVRNRGKAPAQNVIVADGLPGGMGLVGKPSSEARRAKRLYRRTQVRFSRAVIRTSSRKALARQTKAARIRLARARANRRAKLAVANGLATWRLGTLPPGSSRTVTLRVRFAADRARVVGNRAIARADNTARATDAVRTRVRLPRTKTLPAVTG
jgi:uncharacterized repeat protein (TIGR01451 family)